jgi:thiamine biosynthesis protein ThiC
VNANFHVALSSDLRSSAGSTHLSKRRDAVMDLSTGGDIRAVRSAVPGLALTPSAQCHLEAVVEAADQAARPPA